MHTAQIADTLPCRVSRRLTAGTVCRTRGNPMPGTGGETVTERSRRRRRSAVRVRRFEKGRVSYQWRYDMKRFLTLIAATAALGLAGLAYAGGPEDQTGAQPSPAEQRSMPSTDPTTPYATDPSAMAQSSVSTLQSTRLAAIVPSGM